MRILKATILITRHGADTVSLQTDLPEGCFTTDDKEKMCLSFKVAHGGGEYYVKEHFPDIPVEVLNYSKPTVREIKEQQTDQGEWEDCKKCGMKGSGGWCCWQPGVGDY